MEKLVMTIQTTLGAKFIKKKSTLNEKERETEYKIEQCGVDEFNGLKYVLLFFSSGWCPPCE
tara:strand:- start:464 stop:649 length:186 start_codon:yes stop_codon:yes gene_type:complete